MKDFASPVSQAGLNIEDKSRSNLFSWRGQFSPQLIELLLDAYCLPGSIVLDPFAGSGTVLLEAATKSLPAFGFELNPPAWIFSKLYEFSNLPPTERERPLAELRCHIEREFPIILFSNEKLDLDEAEQRIIGIEKLIGDRAKILCNALVVLLDIYNNHLSNGLVQGKLSALSQLVRQLPYSAAEIKADLQDARHLPLLDQSVDFVVTSPPYINVFNYHQNYRRSVELLGWDTLRVAKSEIGSNRANRGNRFLTVIQYCIDMAAVLQEISRVLRPGGRAVLVVGYESRVLGAPFNNADIVEGIANDLNMFSIVLRQQRMFRNRFGKVIREDILNLTRESHQHGEDLPLTVGRRVAKEHLLHAVDQTPKQNRSLLMNALSAVPGTEGTPVFNSRYYAAYQTRENVMMVKERTEYFMDATTAGLPTPHLSKLKALLRNRRLPKPDRPRVEAALERYEQWIAELQSVVPGTRRAVGELVDATNRYKAYIELTLIFDSPEDFLYRQKGQLKLDNTILEEFLPQLLFRGLRLPKNGFEVGPQKTFAGLSFTSSLSNAGAGGQPRLRTKDQDFVLGKRLYMMTSFDKEFQNAEKVEAHLGYVCAECKTNLDKTMFQEAVATSRDLKIAVPASLYFLVCEFLDMAPVSIASTHIDDVLIVRKCKRVSSNVRQEYKTAHDRRTHRDDYVAFLEAAKYYPDVFQRMIDKIQGMADESDPDPDRVLKRGHF